MSLVTVSLHTPTAVYRDIQIWNDTQFPSKKKECMVDYVSTVYYRKIPLYLVSNGPFDVYSEHSDTEHYFFDSIVSRSLDYGVLAKIPSEDSQFYVVFYAEHSPCTKIRCFYIDFSVLQKIKDLHENVVANGLENVYYTTKSRILAPKSDTAVFDRVLESKSSRKSSSIIVPQPSVASHISSFTTSHQIAQAVNKVILSGLRLRGLSGNGQSSAKDKIAIREIYQMTHKAALFALRKYNYTFNASNETTSQGVQLEEIQSIVETLLSTFVDVESASFSHRV